MKLTETQVVFYNAEKDGFLEKYKDRGTLAFEAGYTTELRRALVLIVEAEYNVTKLDGSDFERTEREESMEDRIGALLNLLTN